MSLQAASVRRQRAGVRVDTQQASWTGWTELVVAAPPAAAAAAALGLHCYGLAVQSLTVNGQPASFELVQPVREELPQSVTGAAYDSQQRQVAAVAEAAYYLYERQLQRERQPELSFRLPQEVQQQLQQPGSAAAARGKGGSSGGSSDGSELRVRVEFSGGAGAGIGPSAGLHFWQQYAATDGQVRRTSAWLPCVDSPGAAVQWEGLEVTVRADEVAVGPGQLQRQTWADGERRWRSFHYALPVACPPCHLGFAVGPFRMAVSSLPAAKDGTAAANAAEKGAEANGAGSSKDAGSQGEPQLTSFAPQKPPAELAVAAVLAVQPSIAPANGTSAAADGLARSAHFTGLVWRLFEEVLGARCPLPAVQQAFLPPELLLSASGQVGQGLQLLSASQLIQPRAIEQSIAARCAIARCLARQWFGVLLRAATPLDEWLVEGLSGWLEEQFVQRYLGRNELAYKRWRERQVIFLADNGEAPPLAVRGVSVPSSWGPLFGTERFDPSHLWATKAVAVVAMLEKRAGEELFRKHVSTVVAAGLAALAAEQAAAAGKDGPAAAAAAAVATAVAAPAAGAAGAAAAGADGGSGTPVGSRLLDTMTFLNDLGRAGSFRREMAPFAARWVYGRGVPHVTAGYVYHRGLSVLELALKQTGPACVKRAADYAQRAAAAEGSNAGIIKAVVREGEQYMDHPVHLGGEAFVLTELKVTPPVEKKQPGRRGRKKKEGEDGEEEAAAAVPEDPVRWLRLDPAGEQLIDIKLLQPERQLVAQLQHSRDVVAQAEAIQRLGELAVSSAPGARPAGLEALKRTLADRAVFYRVRCDAALALAGMRDDQGQAAGLPALLEFYRRNYFLPTTDGSDPATPQSIAVSDPSEYFVAQAVVTAISLCREPDGSTRDDVLLFLCACLSDYSSIPGAPFSDYGLVAAMCGALGNINFEGFGDALLTLLEKFLERDAVLVSPGSLVGRACLAAMAALCANGTCDADEAARVATAVRRVRQSPGLPVALRHAAMAAALQMAAAQRGAEGVLQLALAGAAAAPGIAQQGQAAAPPPLQLPSAGTPAFLLEEAVQLVAAASAAAAPSAAAAAAFEPAGEEDAAGGAQALPVPLPLLEQLAALLSAGQDCRLRHLAFVLLQLLAAQPPTLYRPPPTDEAEDAALLAAGGPAVAGQAVSMGVTHRTGQQQASGAAAAAAPKIRLQLGGGGGGAAGGARSMAISGASGPALSGEGPAMSDARARADGAVEQPVPPAAQGQLFSPARQPMDADDASSRWPQQPGAAQQAQQAQQAAAPAAAPKFKLKLAGGPAQPEAATAAAAPAAGPAAAPAASSLLALAQRVQQQTQQAHVPNASAPAAKKRKTPEPAAAAAAQPPPQPAWQQPPAPAQQAQQPWQQQQQQQQQQQAAYPGPAPSPFDLAGGGGAAAAPAVVPSADWFLPQQPAAAAAAPPAAVFPLAAPPAVPPGPAAAGPAAAAAPKKITKIKLKLK